MAEEAISSNKRIAKNTIMLYIRMLLSMVVSLYTSRVVLNTLGVEDYGIYGVVGGIVAMFSFLNSTMSGATSRFLTYEMGRGDFQRLKETFSSTLVIHIGIACAVLILAETVGLWFLLHKLVIPAERMNAALWVYQLSILSMMITVTQVPYNACIIAHEKMEIYAYVEILNVILKLIIVYFLLLTDFDRLIFYAILVLFVSIIIAFIYRFYCISHFSECHFCAKMNSEFLKPILLFSTWDLYGNMTVALRQQGMNFIMNIFWGIIINAAVSLSNMVQGAVCSLSNNVIMAFRPQIIQKYAQNNYLEMQVLLENAIRYSLFLYVLICVPLLVEMEYIFKVWLTNVPLYSVTICRFIIVANVLSILNAIISIPIHATGDVKRLSFMTGTLYLLSLVPMYVVSKIGLSYAWIYVILILFNVLIVISNSLILKDKIHCLLLLKLFKPLICLFYIVIIGSLCALCIHSFMKECFVRFMLVFVVSIIMELSVALIFFFKENEKKYILMKLKNLIRH